MIALKVSKLIQVIDGKIKQKQLEEDEEVFGFSIDSRTLRKNEIFIAIQGENFDGSNYIDVAIKKGSSWIITSSKNHKSNRCIYVKNTKETLCKIASYLVGEVSPKIIAITGSNGKTTTKEMVANILYQHYPKNEILVTKGNLNNDIGLPLTLFNLKKNHTIVVLEMGMNHQDEITKLCKIAPPDIAVITNIGEAHLENFSSKNGIAKAKKEILLGAKKNGIAILPRDDVYFNYLKSDCLYLRCISFGINKNSNIRLDLSSKVLTVDEEKINIESSLLGKENLMNMAAAVSVANALELPTETIIKGMKTIDSIEGRLEVKITASNIKIIDDTYNSNPSSMMMAIDVLDQFKQKKILIVGDMAELGPLSKKYHTDIGHYILEKNIDLVMGIGNMTKYLIDVLGTKGLWYPSKEDLLNETNKILKKDTVVLVKGSRFMRMEEIVDGINEQH
ncbi:UDP-N-acetylmuramoylalanyl-D-glutamyl-2, 6-diaminopimelate-D-alanyl-D-alanyl ligase [Methylophilales bacterium HTCC2181]|uniref:UDP-N-acetylmuramoyl-tripeptide--D-alanyl-D-alanine ligase n=1 Tax=Methylophilales bacterium HTCC2181 TaxID=383631 RepID=A0P5K3_9PROT|nr:UDP-N-acetylmuramoylalanyl-D-glutamyl-2, 6-diaminopimelate-D-alanyl-D-alanyl ligase [Methylophilales bacterium HTCC2181]